MLLQRAVDGPTIRRRAGSALLASCRRDPREISLLVWIRGECAFAFVLEEIGWERGGEDSWEMYVMEMKNG